MPEVVLGRYDYVMSMVLLLAAFGVDSSHAAFGLGNSYLDSLSTSSTTTKSVTPTTTPPATTIIGGSSNSGNVVPTKIQHAPLSYFALDQLVSKGAPRATADWGTPVESSRALVDGAPVGLEAGSWFCRPGGWPSPNPKPHTEVFYVCRGHGCLTDAVDGVRHYFGPGDTVIIPKGHQGRWDVYQDIHKIWITQEHADQAQPQPKRVKVIHYQDYHTNPGAPVGYHHSDAISADQSIYHLGPTRVGIWTTPASIHYPVVVPVNTPPTTQISFVLLKGKLVLASSSSSTTQEVQPCEAGDTVILPPGWSGFLHVLEPVKKLWVQATQD